MSRCSGPVTGVEFPDLIDFALAGAPMSTTAGLPLVGGGRFTAKSSQPPRARRPGREAGRWAAKYRHVSFSDGTRRAHNLRTGWRPPFTCRASRPLHSVGFKQRAPAVIVMRLMTLRITRAERPLTRRWRDVPIQPRGSTRLGISF